MVDPEVLTIGTKVKLIDNFPNPWKSWQSKTVTIATDPKMRNGKLTYFIEEDPMILFWLEDMDYIVEDCEPMSIDISSVL